MPRILRSVFTLAIATTFAISVSARAARPRQAVFEVLAYNDVYELKPDDVNGFQLGGPARVVPLAHAMRSRNPNALVLFAGDTMSPSLWSSQFHGMQMLAAHHAIGVDYACLGNHEFDFGIDGFLNVSKASKFPWLNANCYERATKALLRGTIPRAIRTLKHPHFGTIKIGLFGVMYDMKDAKKELYWTDPIATALREIALLRDTHHVDFVIALTHQEIAADSRLAAQAKGLDLIYGGHDHASMLQTAFGVPFLKAAFDFRSIWHSRIEYFAAMTNTTSNTTLPAVSRMKHEAIPIVENMPSDPALDKVIANTSAQIQALFARDVGKLCAPFDLSQKLVRFADAPIGHLFSDAQLTFYGNDSIDIVLMNGGGIRTDRVYPAGALTLGDMIAWSPFGNTLLVVETDGASLKQFLLKEMRPSCGASGIVLSNGNYVHPAGIQYAVRCTGVNQAELTSLQWQHHLGKFRGAVQDADVFRLGLSNFLFTTEFATISGVRSKLIVSEAEAARVDTALEKFFDAQPDHTVCENGPIRSAVAF